MIQVFSTKTNKPHHYEFVDLNTKPEDNTYGFDPIEFAISNDGKQWISNYDVPNLDGILCVDTPAVASAKQTDQYHKIGIQDGQYILSSNYEQRELKMTLVLTNAIDKEDVELAFDALQSFLVQREPYWICFANWPQRMYYVKVTEISQTHMTNSGFCIEVTMLDQIGLSSSVGTTANSEYVKGFGNNEVKGGDKFSFTESNFVVNNHSAVMIDPERRGHPFKLIAKGSSGGNFKITNKTTNDVVSREKGFSGEWILDGVNPKLNGEGDILNTNHGIITLDMGRNEFQIENFTGTIIFDYPMWWLS